MEVKINKEIRDYTESMFFGLSMRQFFFSAFACAVAVAVYFLLKPILGTEITGWVCILVAFPFAIMGFVKYNGMTAEKFFLNYIRTEIIEPHVLMFKPTNYYYEATKGCIEKHEKEG